MNVSLCSTKQLVQQSHWMRKQWHTSDQMNIGKEQQHKRAHSPHWQSQLEICRNCRVSWIRWQWWQWSKLSWRIAACSLLSRRSWWILSLVARRELCSPRMGVAVITSFRATPACVRTFSNGSSISSLCYGKDVQVKAATSLGHFLNHSYNIATQHFNSPRLFYPLLQSLKDVIFSKPLCPLAEANIRRYGRRQHCLSSQWCF